MAFSSSNLARSASSSLLQFRLVRATLTRLDRVEGLAYMTSPISSASENTGAKKRLPSIRHAFVE